MNKKFELLISNKYDEKIIKKLEELIKKKEEKIKKIETLLLKHNKPKKKIKFIKN